MSERPRGEREAVGDRGAEGAGPPAQKVLYVMGAGRSGSTILGVALGNCEGVFYAGELDHWLVRDGKPSPRRAPLRAFWEGIRASMGAHPELTGGATKSLERSSALLDVRRWPRRRRLRAPYRRVSAELYRAIAAATGAAQIVDSSHYPLRARELRACPEIEIFLIYLVRDPRGVVRSLGRTDVPERTFGWLAANAYLGLTSAVASLVFLGHRRDRRLLVRYERFAADPERVIAEILALCGSRATPPGRGPLRTGAPFHGNRLIESESVMLEPPSGERPRGALTALVQLPWSALLAFLRPAAGR